MPEDNKPSLPSADQLAADLSTIQGLVDKYAKLSTVLPGSLGSALGGLRTALRGFAGHLAAQNAAARNPAPAAPAKPNPAPAPASK